MGHKIRRSIHEWDLFLMVFGAVAENLNQDKRAGYVHELSFIDLGR